MITKIRRHVCMRLDTELSRPIAAMSFGAVTTDTEEI